MTRGNRAILQHGENAKNLRVFRSIGGGRVRYLGEYVYDSHELVPGYDYTGQPREAVAVTLSPV